MNEVENGSKPSGNPCVRWSDQDRDRANDALKKWDGYIIGMATKLAPDEVTAQEVAQVTRLRIAAAVRRGEAPSEGYVRRSIFTACIDVLRAERRAGRKKVENPQKAKARPPVPRVVIVGLEQAADQPEPTVDDNTEATCEAVARWVSSLPPRSRKVIRILHFEGQTQHEAARKLGVSQQRVAQINRELLERGRRDLVGLLIAA